MLTRRVFLQSSALCMALPASANLMSMAAGQPVRIKANIVVSGDCPDAQQFLNFFANSADVIGDDPGEYLQFITQDLSRQKPDLLIGLTRETEFMLVNQVAMEHRYQEAFFGQHRYSGDRLEHKLAGAPEVVEKVSGLLSKSNQYWAAQLAEQAGLLCSSTKLNKSCSSHAMLNQPAGSPGYLVSWVLKRGDHRV